MDSPELVKSAVADLMELYGKGQIKPRIDSTWAFEDVSGTYNIYYNIY